MTVFRGTVIAKPVPLGTGTFTAVTESDNPLQACFFWNLPRNRENRIVVPQDKQGITGGKHRDGGPKENIGAVPRADINFI